MIVLSYIVPVWPIILLRMTSVTHNTENFRRNFKIASGPCAKSRKQSSFSLEADKLTLLFENLDLKSFKHKYRKISN